MDKKTTYRVVADTKAAQGEQSTQTAFLVEAADYKGAWVQARSICRMGATVKAAEGGDDVEIKPGVLTVRKVFTTQKRGGGKSKVVTAEMLIAAAMEHNIPINQKLQALYDELTGGAKPEGEGQQQAA